MEFIVAGQPVEMLVDSGANVNVAPLSFYQCIEGSENVIRLAGNKNIEVFGGTKMEIVETFETSIRTTKSPAISAKFSAVSKEVQAVIGRETAEKLNVLRIGSSVCMVNEGKAPKVFPTIPNVSVKLTIDQSIAPKQITRCRIPEALEEAVKQRLREQIREGIVEIAPHTNEDVSPMHIVAKGKDDFRIVIDMRAANERIKRKFYPIPRITELLMKLNTAALFTSIDLKSAYFHVRLHPESRSVTTFMSPLGPLRYTRLAFGINAAPEIFQELMEEILREEENFVIVFLDDVLIFAETTEQLDHYTKQVIKKLRDNNMTLNKEKCKFNQTSIEFLGFKISKGSIEPTKEKIELINSFKVPANVNELESFLGLVNVVGSFITDLATINEPLRRLTRSNEVFNWGVEQRKAFEEIKRVLKEEPLHHAIFNGMLKTKLYTDASPVGLGAYISQVQSDGSERVVDKASKALTDTEKAYPQSHKETLAVVWGVEKFDYFLLGREFTIVSDNSALRQIFAKDRTEEGKRAVMRFAGWQLRMAPYRFEVEHIPGKNNIAADALSRLCLMKPAPYEEKRKVMDLGRVRPKASAFQVVMAAATAMDAERTITLKEVRAESKADDEIKAVQEALATGKWEGEAKKFKFIADELAITDDILYRDLRLVIPKSLRKQLVMNAHIGHPGIVVMKRTLRSRVWWPGMDDDISKEVRECRGCTAVALDNKPEPMIRSRMPDHPMDLIAIDFWSASMLQEKILVVIDYCSRYVWLKLTKAETSAEVIKALKEIFKTFGKPKTIKADNGSSFSSKEFKKFCEQEDIKISHSTPLWPQANGLVENAMKIVNKTLRIARVEQADWKEALNAAIDKHNKVNIHSTTGIPPAELMFKRRIRDTIQLSTVDADILMDEVKERDQKVKEAGKVQANKRCRAHDSDICIGDTVYMRGKKCDKLARNFDVDMPCTVMEKNGASVTLQTPTGDIFQRNSTAVKKDYRGKEKAETSDNNDGKINDTEPGSLQEGHENQPINRMTLRDRKLIHVPQKLAMNLNVTKQ